VLLAGVALLTLAPNGLLAGGYDTGERDWDALFGAGETVAVESGVRYISPERELSNVTTAALTAGTTTAPEAEAFAVFRASASGRWGDHLRCLASYREPFEGHANYGANWIGAAAVIEQHFETRDYGLTCAGTMPLETGQVSVIAGASYQEAEFELQQLAAIIPGGGPPFTVIGRSQTNVNDSSWGWRLGVAYEIPEYALRASLIYNSQVDYDMSGTVAITAGPTVIPVTGTLSMPGSLELKVQSGVAPGWLAFGSIRWTDWSVADAMILRDAGGTQRSGLELQWQDSWTITAGAVHQLSEQLALTGSLTWDQGATNGFTPQTDTWVGAMNAVFSPNEYAQIVLGGSLGLMTSGSYSTATLNSGQPNPLAYSASFGNDLVYGLNASLRLHF
jgi:long-chain fatty acid transport protein